MQSRADYLARRSRRASGDDRTAIHRGDLQRMPQRERSDDNRGANTGRKVIW